MSDNLHQRIGILGGTFNPIHNGHLILAQSAFEQFELDTVVFLPSGNPPHKENISYIDSAHRAAMVELAIADNPNFSLSMEEIERPGITYTSETLTLMKAKEPSQELYFIIGADSLFTFETWHEPDTICKHCTLLVATREELNPKEINEKIIYLQNKFDVRIFQIKSPDFDISSKYIRNRIFQKESVQYFIPKAVEEYIKQNNLYTTRM